MIPLFSNSQVRDADKFAVSKLGMKSIMLMENASRSIYEVIANNYDGLTKFLPVGIICGKGNNGGDGFALARQFLIRGYNVKVLSLAGEKELKGDALTNFKILKNLLRIYKNSNLYFYKSMRDVGRLKECDVLVDAILGTGTKGNIKKPYNSIILKLNELSAFKVAVDVPSGLAIDFGSGDTAFNANLTVTLAELKTGLFYGKGYVHSGKVVKGSIGIGDEYFQNIDTDEYLVEPEDALAGIPARSVDAHKYTAGKVFIIAGSSDLPGAAVLSAKAAITSGAGAVVLAVPKAIQTLVQQKLDEVVVHPYEDIYQGYLTKDNTSELTERIEWADTVIIGPGLGRNPETIEACRQIIGKYKSKNIVVDADAVHALSEKYKQISLTNCVLTPHLAEFAHLLGINLNTLKGDPINYGKKFCRETGALLVLKGAPSITFTPAGEVLINSSGNQSLAKFGSGDVLTGIIGAFTASNNELENSTVSSVYIHGLIADLLLEQRTELSVNATDLIENIPNAIKFIYNSFI